MSNPVIFSAPMVRAILNGKKTQTRRCVETQPYAVGDELYVQEDFKVGAWRENPPKIAIDYLASPEITNTAWIKPRSYTDDLYCQVYISESRLDLLNHPELLKNGVYTWDAGKLPSRFRSSKQMPEWLSRIKLIVTKARIENLLDISEEDAIAEGFESTCEEYSYGMSLISASGNFQKHWYEHYGDDPKKGLDANPRVFVYEFERIL